VVKEFEDKWGCADSAADSILETLYNEEDGIVISEGEVVVDIGTLKRASRTDAYGICADALETAFRVHMAEWTLLLNHIINDRTWLRALVVSGRVFAKEQCPQPATNMRSILPQPKVLEVVHSVVVARASQKILDYSRTLGSADMVLSAFPGHQHLEIVQALQLSLELGTDSGSWRVCQADVKQYYDHINPLILLQRLGDIGLDRALAITCIGLHSMPNVSLALDGVCVQLPQRAKGLLTGSKSAALLAVVPILDVLAIVQPRLLKHGVPLDASMYMKLRALDTMMQVPRDMIVNKAPLYAKILCIMN
jgi:hypothetical protein